MLLEVFLPDLEQHVSHIYQAMVLNTHHNFLQISPPFSAYTYFHAILGNLGWLDDSAGVYQSLDNSTTASIQAEDIFFLKMFNLKP